MAVDLKIIGIAVSLWLSYSAGALALEPSPSPSPALAPALSQAELLELPAHDVEIFRAPEAPRVGDTLTLKVPGVAPEATIEPAPDLQEQGWFLSAVPGLEENQKEFRFQAAPLKAGHLSIPSLALRSSEGKPIARTNPFNLVIASVIKSDDQKPSEPAPLRGPLTLSFPWWIAIAGALIVLGLLAAAVYFYRKYRRSPIIKTPVAQPVPVLPEDEEALNALKALEAGGLLGRGQFKNHYFSLSEIMKAYLGRRYRFDALESTSNELLVALENKQRLSEKQLDRLEALFGKLDLVKFTDHVPPPSEGLDLLREARELILETRKIPQAAPIVPANAGGSR